MNKSYIPIEKNPSCERTMQHRNGVLKNHTLENYLILLTSVTLINLIEEKN